MNATTTPRLEVIAGGLPIMPEKVVLEVETGEYPVIHAAAVTVSPAPTYAAVIIALHRPDQPAGLFMGMHPGQARSVAAWLFVSADEIDGGLKQSGDIAAQCRAWVLSPDYVDMTARQMAVLSIICDDAGPHHVRHLAKAIGVQKPVISRAIDRFVGIGLATRRVDADDARDRLIEPTALGRKIRAALAGGGQ